MRIGQLFGTGTLIFAILHMGCSTTKKRHITNPTTLPSPTASSGSSQAAQQSNTVPEKTPVVTNRLSDPIPIYGSTQVQRATLSNGLKILLVEDHQSATFAIQTWFDVGSRHEKKGSTGLAHLFEHLMFKATKNYPEGAFDRTLEQAGAEGLNAFTSHDYTAYVQELPKEALETILKLESDRLTNLIVNDATFNTEREVVQNERRQRTENSPDGLIDQTLFELAYQNHSYHWPIIGYEEDLSRMTAQDAADFYKMHYSPHRATIIIVGDIDPDKTFSLIKKYYSDIPSSGINPPETLVLEPTPTGVRRKLLKLNLQVEKLSIAYPVPAFGHPDAPALEVLQGILSEGKGGRLDRSIVQSGIASEVSCGSYELKDPGLFVFDISLQKKKPASLAEATLLKEISRLGQVPPTSDELKRAKNLLKMSFFERLTRQTGIGHFLGQYEIVGGNFETGLKIQRDLEAVTSADIQRVVRQYFAPEKRVVVTGVPKS